MLGFRKWYISGVGVGAEIFAHRQFPDLHSEGQSVSQSAGLRNMSSLSSTQQSFANSAEIEPLS